MSLVIVGSKGEYTNLPVVSEWTEDLPQIETNWDIFGGVNGAANVHAKVLGNRIEWLKANKANKAGDEEQEFEVKAASTPKAAVNKEQMEDAISNMTLPIGFQSYEIIETPRVNQLVCGGGEFLRADFPKFWTWIQTQTSLLKTEAQWQTQATSNGGICGYFSSGDNATTFRLPNLFGAMVKMADGTTRTVGSYQADENKSHTHTGSTNNTGAHTHTYSGGPFSSGEIHKAAVGQNASSYFGTTASSGSHTHTLTIDSSGGTEVRVKNIGVLPLIIAL